MITGMILSRKGDLCDIYGQSWQYLVASLYLQGFRLPAKQTNSNFVLSRKMEVATTTGFHYGTFKGGASLKTVLLVLLILPFLYLTANQSLAQDSLLQREDVIADIRQLANIIENTHPD